MAKKPKAAFTYDGGPFVVIAKKSMHRGGRHWTTGVHDFSKAEAREQLGDDETIAKMIETLALYPNDFEIAMPGSMKPEADAT